MNRLGMLVDLAHTSPRLRWQRTPGLLCGALCHLEVPERRGHPNEMEPKSRRRAAEVPFRAPRRSRERRSRGRRSRERRSRRTLDALATLQVPDRS
eukprot:gene10177-biopygen9556